VIASDDITGIGVVDDVVIPIVLLGTGIATVVVNWDYITDKLENALDVAISWATHKDEQKANDIIGNEKKGSINREFPSEWRDKTYGEIKDAAKEGDRTAQKAKKLLDDKRFDK